MNTAIVEAKHANNSSVVHDNGNVMSIAYEMNDPLVHTDLLTSQTSHVDSTRQLCDIFRVERTPNALFCRSEIENNSDLMH